VIRVRRNGFTLLEVLIAIAILAVGGIILIQTQITSIRLWERYRDSVIARELAQQKLAEAELDGFSGDKQEEGEYEGKYAGYAWRLDSESTTESGFYEVTVTITCPAGREFTLITHFIDLT
jgi:type II secretion system protein I